mmetsp:Transcript_10197/g.26481  ORF Transcript_10197/g.26481 Transcript_10197/m.26481 type:complete len:556 (+) Transcript_10197:50-1717(+)
MRGSPSPPRAADSGRSAARHRSSVLVYSGPGAAPRCVAATLAAIATHVAPGISVREISRAELGNPAAPWSHDALALVMPGGRDQPYCNDLRGEPCARIRSFVEAGGAYVGLCAGAYFGSRRVQFEPGTQLEVFGERELGFFPGTAMGSAYGGFEYGTDNGAVAARISFVDDAAVETGSSHLQEPGRTTRAYFHGGPCLVPDENGPPIEPLAWYADQADAYAGGCGTHGAIAAAAVNVGGGRAVVCGAHPEMGADAMIGGGGGSESVEDAEAEPSLRATLRAHEGSRASLLRTVLAAARVPLRCITVMSYGALLSEKSARLTFPSLTNFRLVRVRGWRRVFAHPHSALVRVGLLPPVSGAAAAAASHGLDTAGGVLEIASLSAEPCAHASMVCAAFDVRMSAAESSAFEAREREYVLARVPFEPLASDARTDGGSDSGGGWGTMCVAADDATARAALGAELYAEVADCVGGTVWGWSRRSLLRPACLYLRHCLLAARAAGPAVERDLLDGTLLVDRKTTLGAYLHTRDEHALLDEGQRQWAALPDDARQLRVRFGG